jgi:hypothetical protein
MQPEWFQRTPEVGIPRQRQPGEEVWPFAIQGQPGARRASCGTTRRPAWAGT